VLGFFMSLGKAAVYKHIPVYYPNNVGAVGGLVGMIGGLGGFVLPIAFGVLNDLTGIWTSCFMLLFVIVAAARWSGCTSRSAHGAGGGWSRPSRSCRIAGNAADPPSPSTRQWHGRSAIDRLAAGGPAFWEKTGRDRAPQSLDLDPLPAAVLRGLDGVVDGGRQAAGGRLQVHTDQLFWLAALPGCRARRCASSTASWCRSSADGCGRRCDLVADDPGARHRLRRAEPRHALLGLPGAGAAVRLRRRQLRLLDGEHQLLLPKAEKGNALALNAGLGNLGVSVVQFLVPLVITAGVFGALGGEPQTATERRTSQALAAERRLHLGAVHHRLAPSPPGSA
jgi:NNP family nitrate/nitrite transporter-like MFS transporter